MKRVSTAVLVIVSVAGAIALVSCIGTQPGPFSIDSESIYALTGSNGNNSSQLLKIDSASRQILAEVEIAGFATKVRAGDHLYVSNGEYITVYNRDLNELGACLGNRSITDGEEGYGSMLREGSAEGFVIWMVDRAEMCGEEGLLCRRDGRGCLPH